jgi:hypothetical protein
MVGADSPCPALGTFLGVADESIAVEHVLPGMTLHPLPDGWTPVEAFVLVKCLDEDGDADLGLPDKGKAQP